MFPPFTQGEYSVLGDDIGKPFPCLGQQRGGLGAVAVAKTRAKGEIRR